MLTAEIRHNPIIRVGRRPFLAMAGAVIAAPAAVVIGAPVVRPRFHADISRALAECESMSLDEAFARCIASVDRMVDALLGVPEPILNFNALPDERPAHALTSADEFP